MSAKIGWIFQKTLPQHIQDFKSIFYQHFIFAFIKTLSVISVYSVFSVVKKSDTLTAEFFEFQVVHELTRRA
jgi:hypothetical protein